MHMRGIAVYGCAQVPSSAKAGFNKDSQGEAQPHREPKTIASMSRLACPFSSLAARCCDQSVTRAGNVRFVDMVRGLFCSRSETKLSTDTTNLTLNICTRGPTAHKKLTVVRLRKPLEPSLVTYEIPSDPEDITHLVLERTRIVI